MSDFKRVNAGAPQGSVLGTLLFLIYVNDISESLLSLTRLFADDGSLFYSASSLADIEGIINHVLRLLVAWAKQWFKKFNPLKTEAILFTLKFFEHFRNLVFNDTQLKFVEDQRHLGLTFSSNGKWHKHIDNILNSATKVVGIMRKLKITLRRIALNQIYVSYVLPIIEYSSVVWDNCTDQDANALEKLQNEAARIVTGLTRSVSLDKLYRECGWVALSERPKNQKLYFLYKAINGQEPSYISDIIPPHIRETTNYLLRNRDNITVPFLQNRTISKLLHTVSCSLMEYSR